jgi:hypothetical protein
MHKATLLVDYYLNKVAKYFTSLMVKYKKSYSQDEKDLAAYGFEQPDLLFN